MSTDAELRTLSESFDEFAGCDTCTADGCYFAKLFNYRVPLSKEEQTASFFGNMWSAVCESCRPGDVSEAGEELRVAVAA